MNTEVFAYNSIKNRHEILTKIYSFTVCCLSYLLVPPTRCYCCLLPHVSSVCRKRLLLQTLERNAWSLSNNSLSRACN